MFALYNILLVLACPVIRLILLAKKRCRPGLRQRLGWLPPDLVESRDGRPTIWVHAVSMGEATAVVPLVQQLKTRYPAARVFGPSVTETGKETVLRRLAGATEHLYFPLDFHWSVRSALQTVRPNLIVVVETEFWPNFLREAAARRIPVILVNGRLSTNSFVGYRRLRPFFRRVLASFTLCTMQTDRDVERMIQLGVEQKRVMRTGNLKYDQVAVSAQATAGLLTRQDLRLAGEEDLFVAGGSHRGEAGGHRRLEPAAWGKGVGFGPHMDHLAEAAEQFLACDAGVMVRAAHEMTRTMTSLLLDRSRLEAMGKAAYQLVLENQGALAR